MPKGAKRKPKVNQNNELWGAAGKEYFLLFSIFTRSLGYLDPNPIFPKTLKQLNKYLDPEAYFGHNSTPKARNPTIFCMRKFI